MGPVTLKNADEKDVNGYLDFMTRLSNDEENYTLSRYSEVDVGRIVEWSKTWGKQTLMVLAYSEGKVVGLIQLNKGRYFGMERQFHVGEVAYAVDKPFRGKGLIYLLFYYLLKDTDVRILTAWVDERNIRSQRVLEKLGFNELGKADEFLYSVKEKMFVNMLFYYGRKEVVERKCREIGANFELFKDVIA